MPLLAVAHLPDIVQFGGVRHYRRLLNAFAAAAAAAETKSNRKQIQKHTHTHTRSREMEHEIKHSQEGRDFTHSRGPAIKTSQRTKIEKKTTKIHLHKKGHTVATPRQRRF